MIPIEIGLAANKTKNSTRCKPLLEKKKSIVFGGISKWQYNSARTQTHHTLIKHHTFFLSSIIQSIIYGIISNWLANRAQCACVYFEQYQRKPSVSLETSGLASEVSINLIHQPFWRPIFNLYFEKLEQYGEYKCHQIQIEISNCICNQIGWMNDERTNKQTIVQLIAPKEFSFFDRLPIASAVQND